MVLKKEDPLKNNTTSVHPFLWTHENLGMERGLGIWEITMQVTYVYRGIAYTKFVK